MTASSSSMRSTWCRAPMMGEYRAGSVCRGGQGCAPTCLTPAPHSSVALWGLTKKKPLALVRQSHGTQGENDLQQPYWVSAVAALRNSDLVATGTGSPGLASGGMRGWGGVPAPFLVRGCTHFISVAGSHSGSVKLWKCGEGFRKLEPLCDIPLVWGGEVPQWWWEAWDDCGAVVLMPVLLSLGWLHQQPEVFSNGRLPGGWRWAGAPVLSPCPIFQNLDRALPLPAPQLEQERCGVLIPVSSAGWAGGGEPKKPRTASASSP